MPEPTSDMIIPNTPLKEKGDAMKIEKTPSGKYRIRPSVNGKQRCITFDHKPTKKECEQAIMDLKSSIGSGQKSTATFLDRAREYISINSNTLKPSTRRAYDTFTRSLSETFLNKPLEVITQADIQAEINVYAATHAPKGVRNAHGFISRVITFYRPDMVIRTNLPAKQKYDKYVPTREEVYAVLEECKGTMFWGCYSLACYGLRKGELVALTLADLSDDDVITINKAVSRGPGGKYELMQSPKTEASFRQIKIDHELAEFFRAQGYIYKGTPDYLYQELVKIQNRLGQHHWRLHDFRGYMATELHHAGVCDSSVLAIGGWASDYTMKAVYRKEREMDNISAQDRVVEILAR